MEINITEFFKTADPFNYSASRVELGDDAGKITWHNACQADFNLLDTDVKRDAFKKHVAEFGAWDDDEIRAWSTNELNALFIQMISGDIREAGLDTDSPDWAQYEIDANAGLAPGNFFLGSDGEIYYYVGS